ncbi:hypothetical protein C0J52_09778 [Blattella germanica]|nr:hypothetical protein C0J52_09778 [Blattella germanica]
MLQEQKSSWSRRHIQQKSEGNSTVSILVEVWTELFNKCLQMGCIPDSWKNSEIKILYKGKENVGKVMMVFRRGGRMTTEDRIKLEAENLQRINFFQYLGIMLQTIGLSFKIHVQERCAAAIRAIYDVTLQSCL